MDLRNVGILPSTKTLYSLKIEAARYSETSVSYHITTRHQNPEDLEQIT